MTGIRDMEEGKVMSMGGNHAITSGPMYGTVNNQTTKKIPVSDVLPMQFALCRNRQRCITYWMQYFSRNRRSCCFDKPVDWRSEAG